MDSTMRAGQPYEEVGPVRALVLLYNKNRLKTWREVRVEFRVYVTKLITWKLKILFVNEFNKGKNYVFISL